MKIILHIGSDKTGSTSLQSSLSSQRDILASHGILYPELTDSNNGRDHKLWSMLYYPKDNWPRAIRSLFRRKVTDDDIEEAMKTTTEQIKQQVSDMSPKVLVLSAEYLSDGTLIPKLPELANFLKEMSDDIQIVYYARDPIGMFKSSTQQKLKRSSTFKPPEKFMRDHKRIVEAYENIFGESAVAIRPFNRSQLEGGCIVEDFIKNIIEPAIGETLPTLETIPQNISMSADKMAAIQRVRQRYIPDMDDKETAETVNLRHAIKMYEEDSPKTVTLKDGVDAAIVQAQSEQLAWLKSRGIDFDIPDEVMRKPYERNWSLENPQVDELFEVDENNVKKMVDYASDLFEIPNSTIISCDASKRYPLTSELRSQKTV